MGRRIVRPMDEKSTGKIGQQHRQDRVAKLLFALTFILIISPFFNDVSPTFFLVISSSLAISVFDGLTNERLSFIC